MVSVVIFVDTGAFYARAMRSDAHHALAVATWPKLDDLRVYTSSLVLCETAELLLRRADAEFAVSCVSAILAEPKLTILRPSADEERTALELMLKYSDQPIGFADCISMALMKKLRIRRVFSFDRHFRAAGFTLWPQT
jgi:uncharacterized protein